VRSRLVELCRSFSSFVCVARCWLALTSESVERSSLSLERVDDIHCGDGLSSRVFGVGDGIADDMLEEDLEDSSGLLIDEAADSLDAASASETANGRLGDSLDVVAEDLAVTLSATLAETLATLAATGHVERRGRKERTKKSDCAVKEAAGSGLVPARARQRRGERHCRGEFEERMGGSRKDGRHKRHNKSTGKTKRGATCVHV
jgi:hypothetical protein